MIRPVFAFAFFSLALAVAQQARPPKLSVYTWVREDIFAGFLAGDLKQFQAGVDKLDRILAENPDDVDALVFRGGAEFYSAVRAHEAGRSEDFTRLYTRALEMMDRAYAKAPQNQGVLAVIGGVSIIFADRLPPAERTRALEAVRARYGELATEQEAHFDKMPVHMRGEVLGGLAQAELRLGNTDAARTHLTRIVATMQGTPYEAPAKKWLDNPEAAQKPVFACLSCHEPGRLKNRLASLNQP